jgi:hypothetical protein
LRDAHCCRVDTPLASFVERVENPTDNTRPTAEYLAEARSRLGGFRAHGTGAAPL